MAKDTTSKGGYGAATRLVHAAPTSASDALARTVSPPVQRGSTVLIAKAADLYSDDQPTYGRQGLSAQTALMQALDDLEGAAGTCLYPSGMAAISGVLLALLKAGDDILVADCCYAPTHRFADRLLARYGVTVRYFDPVAPAADVLALATPATRLIMLESPGSLTFEISDVPGIARLARARGILTAIDNTYGCGLLFRPLDHGVDVSVQALTKYVGGHSDVFMGSASARDPAVLKALQDGVLQVGWAVSPDDAYQMLRGLRTLPVRLAQHGAGALAVAAWLQDQPEVAQVLCPALPGAPGHALYARDFTGTCGLFSFVLQPAAQDRLYAFLDALQLFGLGFSWGGFESLAIHCDPQFGARTLRPKFAGPLIRLHVGLEDVGDLIADLRQGLDRL